MQIISNKKWNALQLEIKALQSNSLANAFRHFTSQIFPHYAVIKELDTYQTIDDIYAVVKKLATASALIPFYAYDKKADTDLPDTDKLYTFLETLSFEEKEKLYTFLYLQGEVFAYKNIIEEGVNKGASKLTLLNPAKVTVALTNEFPIEIAGYRYDDPQSGITKEFSVDEIMFIPLPNPSASKDEEWRGLSPIKVLAQRLTRVQSCMDVTVAQLQNGGVPGIVFPKTPGTSVETASRRQDNLGRFIRNAANKGAPYSSADELGYIAIGTALADLEVAALANIDFDKICNAYGVSSVLFNNKSASTESNVQEMVKEMYTNTIIPNVYRVEGALNKYVVPDIQTKGIIKCDVSEIEALKEDQTKLVTALKDAWWLTGNEKRERMEYDQDTAIEEMDRYLVPSGVMLIEDLSIVVDEVPNTACDYMAPVKSLKQANG